MSVVFFGIDDKMKFDSLSLVIFPG
jgi:hypothetical protein